MQSRNLTAQLIRRTSEGRNKVVTQDRGTEKGFFLSRIMNCTPSFAAKKKTSRLTSSNCRARVFGVSRSMRDARLSQTSQAVTEPWPVAGNRLHTR